MPSVLLVHGGLWEDMDAERFWVRPGVVAGLLGRGFEVIAPDRLRRPSSWAADVDRVAAALPPEPVVVVGGSNGCTVAALLAVARPDAVRALVLAWPATAGDPRVDGRARAEMAARGADPATVDALLAGGLLRGVSDADLRRLSVPVAVVPSRSGAGQDNPFHQRRTAEGLSALIPGAVRLPGCAEAPRPEFAGHREGFVAAVAEFVESSGDSPEDSPDDSSGDASQMPQ